MIRMNNDPTLQPLPTIDELKNLAASDFDQWLRLIITGGARLPFGSSATYDSHPLRRFFDSQRVFNQPIFLHYELMTLWAERLGYCEVAPGDANFIAIRERVRENLLMDLDPIFAEICERANSVEGYLFRFIQEAEQLVGMALNDVAWDVAKGAPLYAFRPGMEPLLLNDTDLPSAYLNGRAVYGELDGNRARLLPGWVEGHGFRRSDLEALSLFFTSDPSELGAPQLAALRLAYRSHIGAPTHASAPAAVPNKLFTGSRLMKILQEVRERYYDSARFSLADRDTWPKQTAIVEWLKTERGLSEREATAIDVVVRPDEIRGK